MSTPIPVQTFLFPNRIVFGPGSLKELPDQLEGLGIKRPLLVTDPGLVECGVAGRAHETAVAAGSDGPLFDGVDGNPVEENVLAGLEAYRSGKCDGVVAVGGGSPLDVAKAIRLKVNHPLPLEQYAFGRNGWEKMTEPFPPMIAVPTTAGTGSEVARGSVIIVRPSGAKVGLVGEPLYPSVTIGDPELTAAMPPHLTAATGMDALTHCIEEYLSPKYSPFVNGMVLEGIRLAAKSLPRAFEDGSDLEARADMMVASMIGGIGFIKGLGVIHSIAHAFGAIVGGHHGAINAILLPAALEFNLQAGLDRFRPMAVAAGLDTSGRSDEDCAQAFIRYIRELNQSLGLPPDLSVFGAKREHIPPIVPLCMADHCRHTNPRPCAEADFQALLEAHIPA